MTKLEPCISSAKTSSFMTLFYTNILLPRSSLTFLNTGGALANVLIYGANLYTGLKDTVLLRKAVTEPQKQMERLKAAGEGLSTLSVHLHSHSYSLLTSFLSVRVVTSAGTLLEKA